MKPRTERQEQILFVGWFRKRYPEASRVFFAVPNGSARNAWTAKNLKDEGVLAGVSDLVLLLPRHGYAALCIEMKKAGGKQSENQKRFEEACKDYKVKYVVCYSAEEAKSIAEWYIEK